MSSPNVGMIECASNAMLQEGATLHRAIIELSDVES